MQNSCSILMRFARTCVRFSQQKLVQQQQQQLQQHKRYQLWQQQFRYWDSTTASNTIAPVAAKATATAATACTLSINNSANVNNLLKPSIYQQSKQECKKQLQPSNSFPSLPSRMSIPITTSTTLTKSQLLAAAKFHIYARSYSKFHIPKSIDPVPFCETRAHELITNLTDTERQALRKQLDKYEALKLKEAFEGKLAATQWRTRFGRLSKVPTVGNVDPTGTFCEFPEDWFLKRAAQPALADLRKIFFVNAVPFVAFGFLDNFIMIIAGDSIELLFGTFMSISTLAAAGLGNTVSDIVGIGSATYVERGCELLGLKSPDLTPAQMEMKSSKRYANWGRIIGISVGCLLGMFPLLIFDPSKDEKEAKAEPNAEVVTATT